VADVSCDVEGSIEFLTQTTSVEAPFLYYKPLAAAAGGQEGYGAATAGAVEMDGEGVRCHVWMCRRQVLQ
jgi:hypothetical protein